LNFCQSNYSFNLELAGFRTSTNKYSTNESNFLIFVKNSHSFSFLYSEIKWPDRLCGDLFTIDRQPSIPPQLALIITNVGYKINFNEFENDLRIRYDNVVKVIRLKNKDQQDTKIVKVEFSSSKTRDEILNNGSMIINYIKYDIREYLAQATILICSKCMGLGHFRKQCKQNDETCKVCGERVNDLNNHNCNGLAKCIHCGGDHNSNDAKCKVIKQFRSDLTKTLLSSSNKSFNHQVNSLHDFPTLPHPQKTTVYGYKNVLGAHNGIMSKLDEILNSINNIYNITDNLSKRIDRIEEWTREKQQFDCTTDKEIKVLQLGKVRLEGELLNQANVIEKLIVPALDDILMLLMELNVKDGRVLNADFKSRSGVLKNGLKAFIEKRLSF